MLIGIGYLIEYLHKLPLSLPLSSLFPYRYTHGTLSQHCVRVVEYLLHQLELLMRTTKYFFDMSTIEQDIEDTVDAQDSIETLFDENMYQFCAEHDIQSNQVYFS